MHTRRVPVAEGVDLAVDTWPPAEPTGARAPAIVLVHGLASNARLWDGVAARLAARGHLAVTIDLRGHGRSAKPDHGYDMATVADDVAAVIAALDLDRPIVAGQSWGGNVVVELAARHPDRTRGIACVDGGWLEPSTVFASWEACLQALAPPRLAGLPFGAIEERIRSRHPDWPETGIQGALANFERRSDGTVAPWLTYDRHVAVLRGLWDHHPGTRYPAIAVPVLLVPAETDDGPSRGPRRDGVERALAALPDGRIRWFTGDHDIHAQHPVELADVMLEQLAGVPA